MREIKNPYIVEADNYNKLLDFVKNTALLPMNKDQIDIDFILNKVRAGNLLLEIGEI